MTETVTRREAMLFTALSIPLIGNGNACANGNTADMESVMKYVRVYADADGESHFEEIKLDMPLSDFGTENVPKLGMTEPFNASKIFFVRVESNRPDHRDMDWHTAPDRRIAIWLKGETEINTSDGEVRRFGPGDVALGEDTTGKGHRSRNLSDVLIAFIPLSE